jgi:hypothetical protein
MRDIVTDGEPFFSRLNLLVTLDAVLTEKSVARAARRAPRHACPR